MKKTLLILLSMIIIISICACGNEDKKNVNNSHTVSNESEKKEETSTKNDESDVEVDTEKNTENVSTEDSNVDDNVGEKVEFESFLIERCVRKTLGKGWDEDVTTSDLAKIKELVIQEVYNPAIIAEFTIGTQGDDEETGGRKTIYEGELSNFTYIDLSDLKYFVNLEVLKIDNINTDSMIANIDAITNCKELKELYLLYNFSGDSPKNFGGVGYLYWAGIIAELPKLKVVDFSTYLDSKAQANLLSKTSNKDIQIVQHDMETVGRVYWRHTAVANYMKYIDDAKAYKSAWNHDYRGLEKTSQLVYKSDADGVFPYLEAKSEAEVEALLSSLDADTEDIIIKLDKTIESIDLNLFSRFEKLVTLTVINESTSRVLIETWNEELGCYTYEVKEYEMPTIVNSSALKSNKNLKSISLVGLDGDFTGITEITDLRELYMSGCVVGSCDYAKLNKLNTFVSLNFGTNNEIYNLKNAKSVKMFMISMEQISDIIDGMNKLETLIVVNGGMDVKWSEINTPSLKNLFINQTKSAYRLDDEALTNIKEIDNLAILKMKFTNDEGMMIHMLNPAILLDKESLYSIVIPYCNVFGQTHEGVYDKRQYVSANLAEQVKNKSNLSQFIIEDMRIENQYMDSSYLSNVYDLRVYEAGVYTGFVDKYTMGRQIGGGTSSVDACIERVLDALIASDEEMFIDCLYTEVAKELKNSYGMSGKDILVSYQNHFENELEFYSKRLCLEESVYRGYTIKETYTYTREQIEGEFEGFDTSKIQEVIEVELDVPRWVGTFKGNVTGDVLQIVKVDGKYYLSQISDN